MSTHEMIFNFIVENPCRTELEIATGVGLKKTPYTRRILLELLEHGYVARYFDESRKPRPAFVYYKQETQNLNLN